MEGDPAVTSMCYRRVLAAASAIGFLVAVESAQAQRPAPVSLGMYSQQAGPAAATVSARISEPARPTTPHSGSSSSRTRSSTHSQTAGSSSALAGATAQPPPFSYPGIGVGSPLLQSATPRGPQTFWYSDGSGHLCIYVPIGSADCYTPVGVPSAAPAALNPGAVAAAVASRMDLTAGRIEMSPARAGLTGAESWFWLDPAPQPRQLSVSLAGETVSVSATPEVEWRFGDGGVLSGGGGVPYVSGTAPAAAIRHSYETRCLPGDAGNDPNVLASCGSDGYTVAAVVSWRIDYDGSGPVAASGALPTRTTTSSTDYPVSEARAFLLSGRNG